jgi:hypothetical protein
MKKVYFYRLKKVAWHIYWDTEVFEISLGFFNFIIEK